MKTEIKGSARPCAFQKFQGRVLPCLLQLLVAQTFLDCGCITPVSASLVTWSCPVHRLRSPPTPKGHLLLQGHGHRRNLTVTVIKSGRAVPGVPRPGLPGRRGDLWPWAQGARHPPPPPLPSPTPTPEQHTAQHSRPAYPGWDPFEGSWFCPCVRTASPIALFMERRAFWGPDPTAGEKREVDGED